MPKCLGCGKWGFFLRLNSEGICLDCLSRQEQQRKLEEQRLKEIHEEQRKKEADALSQFRIIFPVTTSYEAIQKLWSWYPVIKHDHPAQIDRQKRIFESTIPIFINTKYSFAYFLASDLEKIYDTDLLGCTCPDYSKREEPCKHMYRLFYELTHQPGVVPAITDVRSEVIEKFLTPEETDRIEFLRTYCILERPEYTHQLLKSTTVKTLIQVGLLAESPDLDYLPLLKGMTKDEIILSLAKKGISGFAPSWSKVKLIDWVVENHQQYLRKQFINYAVVSIDPSVIEWARGVKKSYKLQSESLMLRTDAVLKDQNTLDIFRP